MGKSGTHYFNVKNLSMGGASLISDSGVSLEAAPGDIFEILLVGGNISLRCVGRFVQGTVIDRRFFEVGIEITGIDEKSRKTLADFLELLEKTPPSVQTKTDAGG